MDIEQKLNTIHRQRRSVEEVRKEAGEQLADAMRKVQEGRKLLSGVEESLEECTLLQKRFVESTGSGDPVTEEMIRGFTEAKAILSSRISGYEKIHADLTSSLKTADAMLAELTLTRTSSVN